MSFDYAGVAASASDTLAEFGRIVTLRSVAVGTYDASTGIAPKVNTDHSVKAALLDYGVGVTSVKGNLVIQDDKRLLMEAGVAVPTMRDEILIGAVQYGIISIGEINPAGTPVLYDLHVRR